MLQRRTKGDDEEGGAGADGNIAEPGPSTPLPSYEAQVPVEALLEVGELSCTFESVELGAGGSISGTVVLSKALVAIPPEPPTPELTLDDIVPERPVSGLYFMRGARDCVLPKLSRPNRYRTDQR